MPLNISGMQYYTDKHPNILDNPKPITFISVKFIGTQYNYTTLYRNPLQYAYLIKDSVSTYKMLNVQ